MEQEVQGIKASLFHLRMDGSIIQDSGSGGMENESLIHHTQREYMHRATHHLWSWIMKEAEWTVYSMLHTSTAHTHTLWVIWWWYQQQHTHTHKKLYPALYGMFIYSVKIIDFFYPFLLFSSLIFFCNK